MGRAILRILILSGAVAGATAHQPEPFRVRVSLVPVDVLVVDRQGRPVRGLTPDDFEVTEDGAPQRIVYFAEGHGSAPYRSVELAGDLGVEAEELRSPAARSFLIYLGRGRHAENFGAVRHLADFVEQKLNPVDRVAVMAYNRATEFTTDHARIGRVIRAYEQLNPEIEAKLDSAFRGLAGIYREAVTPPELQRSIDRVFESEGLAAAPLDSNRRLQGTVDRSAARAAAAISRIESLDAASAAGQLFEGTAAGDGGPSGAPVPSPFDRAMMDVITDLPFEQYVQLGSRLRFDVGNIWSAIDYLGTLEGEKHLLALTEEGWNLGRQPGDGVAEAPEVTLGRLASHARVRLQIIHTGGMGWGSSGGAAVRSVDHGDTSFASVRPIDDSYASMSMESLAELTGGRAYAHRRVDGILDSILAATEAYYLLGYVPSEAPGAEFREIGVRVKRRGLRVLHRTGYYTETEKQRSDRERARIQRLTLAAARDPRDLTGVRLASPRLHLPDTGAGTGLDQATLISLQPRAFVADERRFKGRLSVLYALLAEDGRLLWTLWDSVEVGVPTEIFQLASRQAEVHQAPLAFRIDRHLPLDPALDPIALKIVVLDNEQGRIGSLTVPIDRVRR